MYDKISEFDVDSDEYGALLYRIRCGQHYQQQAIDRAKGVESKPMPTYWYNMRDAIKEDDETGSAINRIIVSNKKPYFFIYRYKNLAAEYSSYIKSSKFKCSVEFGKKLSDLIADGPETDEERDFLYWYYEKMPVNDGQCVMNRLCHMVEAEVSAYKNVWSHKSKNFNYSIYRTSAVYDAVAFNAVSKIIEDATKCYNRILRKRQKESGDSPDVSTNKIEVLKDAFNRCVDVCGNVDSALNAVLDCTYGQGKSQQIAWGMAGERMVDVLAQKCGYRMKYYSQDECGVVEFQGYHFNELICDIGGCDDTDSE